MATKSEIDERDAEYGIDDRQPFIDIDFRAILDTLLRNKVWIGSIMGAVLISGVIATMLMTPKYVASSKVLVEQKADKIIEGTDLQAVSDAYGDAERFLQTQTEIIGSRALAKRVVKDQKLADDEGFFRAMGMDIPTAEDIASTGGKRPSSAALEQERKSIAVAALSSALSTDLPDNSRIITISVKTDDPAYSAKLANAYAASYMKANLDQKFDSSAYARNYLAGQLEQAREKLAASEHDLNQYARAAGLIRVSTRNPQGGDGDAALSVTDDSLSQINQTASLATAERIAAQDKWQTVAKEPVLSIPEVLQNPAIQSIIDAKAKVEANLAQERTRHLDAHPTVQALKAQVAELDGRIQSMGDSIKQAIFVQYKAARDKEESLKSQVSALRSAALDEQDRGVQYVVLKRVADTNRALYDSLLERFNQVNASAGSAANNITLVDSAELPDAPSSPSLFRNLLIALFLGAALSAVVVYLREHFDDEIRSPDELEQRLGLPMLGVIPRIEGDLRAELQNARSPVSEAYHSLTTNLLYATASGLPRSLVVTSPAESQGKSTSALAIALDLAHLGRKVLLVDGDLRRPTLHLSVEERGDQGLTAVLTGAVSLDSALQPGAVPGLTILTALPIPANPSVLLGSERFPALIRQMEELFDIVIIDSPPMLGLSDAASISTAVEAAIVMIDASSYHRGAVKSMLRRLHLVGANILGAAITKFDPSAAGSEYSHYGNYYQYHHEADS